MIPQPVCQLGVSSNVRSGLFAGNGLYITNANQTGLARSGDFSISCDVMFTSLPSSTSYAYFAAKDDYNVTNTGNYAFYLYNLSGTYYLYLRYITTNSGTQTVRYAYRAWSTPVVDTWYNVAVTHDYISASGHYTRFWVNGVQVGATFLISTTDLLYAASTQAFTVGYGYGSTSGDGRWFYGYMDNVCFWSIQLADATVLANYQARKELTAETSQELALLLNGDATDSHANGNDMSTTGGGPAYRAITPW